VVEYNRLFLGGTVPSLPVLLQYVLKSYLKIKCFFSVDEGRFQTSHHSLVKSLN
jgi:hypothetical protein